MKTLAINAQERWELLALVGRFLPGVALWAFGSRVAGTARSNSDLDLVAFANPEQSEQVQELREALEESDLPFRVDLLIWDDLPPDYQQSIAAGRVVLQASGAAACSGPGQ